MKEVAEVEVARKGISIKLRTAEATLESIVAGCLVLTGDDFSGEDFSGENVTGEDFTGKLASLLLQLEQRLGSFSAVIQVRLSTATFLA